jgi:hypothetical protein
LTKWPTDSACDENAAGADAALVEETSAPPPASTELGREWGDQQKEKENGEG